MPSRSSVTPARMAEWEHGSRTRWIAPPYGYEYPPPGLIVDGLSYGSGGSGTGCSVQGYGADDRRIITVAFPPRPSLRKSAGP